MKRFAMFVLLTAIVVVFANVPTVSAFERFEVGMRIKSVMLSDDKSESFVGSINELDERDPRFVPFVGFHFTPRLGVELSYNQIRVKSVSNYPGDVSTDGDFTFGGPAIALIGRLPNSSRFTPYAGAGATYYVGGFDPTDFWAQTGDKRRNMEVPDAFAPTVFVGMDIRIWKRLYVDLRAGYEWMSTDISFSADVNGNVVYDKGPFETPFDNPYFSVGIAYKH